MNNTSKLITALFLSCCTSLCAQESVNASGATGTGSGGTVTFSIGQVAFTSGTGSGGTASQGVQQAYEIYINGVAMQEELLNLRVYPNPATDMLQLHSTFFKNEAADYVVYNTEGKAVATGKIIRENTEISMAGLAQGTYILNVVHNNKEVQSFKIIKK